MKKGYKENNTKKSVSELKVSVSAAFLLLLHFLYDHGHRHHPYRSFNLRCKNAPGYNNKRWPIFLHC